MTGQPSHEKEVHTHGGAAVWEGVHADGAAQLVRGHGGRGRAPLLQGLLPLQVLTPCSLDAAKNKQKASLQSQTQTLTSTRRPKELTLARNLKHTEHDVGSQKTWTVCVTGLTFTSLPELSQSTRIDLVRKSHLSKCNQFAHVNVHALVYGTQNLSISHHFFKWE